MSYYVDTTVDVTKLPQFDKIKKVSDLANAILAHGGDFCHKESGIHRVYEGVSYAFKTKKINRSKYIDNIELFIIISN